MYPENLERTRVILGTILDFDISDTVLGFETGNIAISALL